MTEKMTITSALSELKILNKRIADEISGATFCETNKHVMRTLKGKSIADVKSEMQATYDKITSLIVRNNAIKKAVTKANAETNITVGGEQMTIAEAIYMKQTGIDYFKNLLTNMSIQYTSAQHTITCNNGDTLTQNCEAYITKLFGTSDTKTASSDLITAINAAKEKYIEENTIDLIEGVDIAKAIENLKNKIDAFEAEVDAAITVANATTVIEISY